MIITQKVGLILTNCLHTNGAIKKGTYYIITLCSLYVEIYKKTKEILNNI